ncbi:MAG: 3-hydroxyacyl-CoA dehydrogenase family protein [Thermodesulfobacteriota bacterium]
MNAQDIQRMAVIGAGTMGAGLALSFAVAGIEARLFDISPRQLEVGRERIAKALALFQQEGVVSPEQARAVPGLIPAYRDRAAALDGAQFVLEAVPEDLALKQRLMAQMQQEAAPGTVLASNTSALYITQIAAQCPRPELVCGMHWWNPPELVPLVEVVKGQRTSEATARLVYELCQRVDRVPIMVKKEAPGFVGNRMQLALFREAMHIVEQGIADPQDVDRAVKHALGFRWSFIGPLETADLGNLDTWHRVASYLFPFLSDAKEPPARLGQLVAQGHLGVQTGQGLYDYTPQEAADKVRRRDLYFLRERRLVKEVSGN